MVEIREEFFGPPGNDEVLQLRADLTAARNLHILADKAVTTALEQLSAAEKRIAAIESRIDRIERGK